MSTRTPMDKAQARERRNQLLKTAAAATLSINEGVREMRAISGLTQEEFARHREVSARVIKAIELGQANPTVATLNQIGQFFGLEVGFIPVAKTASVPAQPQQGTSASADFETVLADLRRHVAESIAALENAARSIPASSAGSHREAGQEESPGPPPVKKRKPRLP